MNSPFNWLQHLAAGLDTSFLPDVKADQPHLQQIFNIVFVIAGALAVLMIVVAGVRFIISRGNPQETAKARTAILFAVGGLVVIILATAIVNFVVVRFA